MMASRSLPITKEMVWQAYGKVKRSNGSAGVDEQTIAEFDRNLSGNLYKLWNRLSSGSYFPPAVKEVEIPKGEGKVRKLGIPK
jgi:RNA-directed DNA polymerase